MRTCRIYLIIMHPHPTPPREEEFSLPSSSKTVLELILSDFDQVTPTGLNQPQCTSHGRRGPEEQRRPTPPIPRMGEGCFPVGKNQGTIIRDGTDALTHPVAATTAGLNQQVLKKQSLESRLSSILRLYIYSPLQSSFHQNESSYIILERERHSWTIEHVSKKIGRFSLHVGNSTPFCPRRILKYERFKLCG